MSTIYTYLDEGNFTEVALDNEADKEIADIIRMFEVVSDENKIQEQLKMFKAEGLIKAYEGDKDSS